MRIKDISKENRPREQFLKSGAASLSDAELLAVILQTGTKDENAIDMSNCGSPQDCVGNFIFPLFYLTAWMTKSLC